MIVWARMLMAHGTGLPRRLSRYSRLKVSALCVCVRLTDRGVGAALSASEIRAQYNRLNREVKAEVSPAAGEEQPAQEPTAVTAPSEFTKIAFLS